MRTTNEPTLFGQAMRFPAQFGVQTSVSLTTAPGSMKTYRKRSRASAWRLRAVVRSIDATWMRRYASTWTGSTGTFAFEMPQWIEDPDISSTLSCNAASAGTSVLVHSGSVAVPVDRFVKLSGHSKVYQVVASSSGSATVFPVLTANVANNTTLLTSDSAVQLTAFGETAPLFDVRPGTIDFYPSFLEAL